MENTPTPQKKFTTHIIVLLLLVIVFLVINQLRKTDDVEVTPTPVPTISTVTIPLTVVKGTYEEIASNHLGFADHEIDIVTQKVSPDTDLVIVTDLDMSGAYNLGTFVYLFKKEGSGFVVSPAKAVVTDEGNKVVNLGDPSDANEDNYNAHISTTDKNLHIYGMRLFSLYPCNIDRTYEFHNDRFILTKKTQSKGCINTVINGPEDIPENFDDTPVDIYKITPQALEAAKKVKI